MSDLWESGRKKEKRIPGSKEEMKTGKNEVNVMSVNITIVSLFYTDSASIWNLHKALNHRVIEYHQTGTGQS